MLRYSDLHKRPKKLTTVDNQLLNVRGFDMPKTQKLPMFVVQKDEHYRDIIVNGVFGGHRPGFFEALIYTEEIMADEALSSQPIDSKKVHIQRTLKCRLILDPVQAKVFAKWLNYHISAFERDFGKIVTPEELGKKISDKKTPVV